MLGLTKLIVLGAAVFWLNSSLTDALVNPYAKSPDEGKPVSRCLPPTNLPDLQKPTKMPEVTIESTKIKVAGPLNDPIDQLALDETEMIENQHRRPRPRPNNRPNKRPTRRPPPDIWPPNDRPSRRPRPTWRPRPTARSTMRPLPDEPEEQEEGEEEENEDDS